MAFPLAILLIPFGLVTLFALVFLFFNLFHLARYGIQSTATTTLMISYVAVFFVVLLGMGAFLATVDWGHIITFADLLPFSGAGNDTFGL